jgi:hypothetical protein
VQSQSQLQVKVTLAALPARLLLRADQMSNKRTKSKKPEQNEEKFCTKSREQKSPPGIRFSNGQFTGFSERC